LAPAATTEGEPPPVTRAEAMVIRDDIPGIGRRVAEQIVAEVGADIAQFHSAAHLASWAKRSPGNHARAGKHKTASVGTSNTWLRSTLV
jgi:transposase